MPRIRCFYSDCVHLEDGFCGAPIVEIDPDIGCRTYSQVGEQFLDEDEDAWDDDLAEWDEDYDDDDWLDDDDF
ncbi:MAG: hypothetical protein JW862_17605 [Anaerolineales bacterium]|nr:hypothetical protein [Anaerolineales bacterium]